MGCGPSVGTSNFTMFYDVGLGGSLSLSLFQQLHNTKTITSKCHSYLLMGQPKG